MATRINQATEKSNPVALEKQANSDPKVEYWDQYCGLHAENDACRVYDV
ncbi:hypothetical protein C1752_02259 [Acaryochloris thomasi RCC1774]|uniref:CP12 domain-containing protein n=1 Tax=Acaryochloris thomasi RCC1774 TaxID=1764569 RepID=A0A2W1JRL5_9CYAN|nr:hypothetical protein [Acaryochloris thomasi]PZD73382.1 hypothetical protein C1752_02259 [Acaryochloris thomasi RCC1774]